jgi:hypothetical protein
VRSGTKFYSYNFLKSLVVTIGFLCMGSTWFLTCNSCDFAWDGREFSGCDVMAGLLLEHELGLEYFHNLLKWTGGI